MEPVAEAADTCWFGKLLNKKSVKTDQDLLTKILI